MYAKIFGQIFDSSIAADYVVRHVFMDLLVLADRDGVVDMTLDAISRRTNVPEAIVSHAIEELMKPDDRSRSHIEDGRRLILLDSHRNWGWQIVNYDHYRTIRDEESRKAYFRDYKRQYRQKSKLSTQSPTMSTVVLDSPTLSTKAEADADVKVEEKEKTNAPPKAPLVSFSLPEWIDRDAWNGFEEMRKKIRAPLTDRARQGIVKELQKLCPFGSDGSEILDQSTRNSWRGVFPLNGNGHHKPATLDLIPIDTETGLPLPLKGKVQ